MAVLLAPEGATVQYGKPMHDTIEEEGSNQSMSSSSSSPGSSPRSPAHVSLTVHDDGVSDVDVADTSSTGCINLKRLGSKSRDSSKKSLLGTLQRSSTAQKSEVELGKHNGRAVKHIRQADKPLEPDIEMSPPGGSIPAGAGHVTPAVAAPTLAAAAAGTLIARGSSSSCTAAAGSDGKPPLVAVGIITLEDVIEELMQVGSWVCNALIFLLPAFAGTNVLASDLPGSTSFAPSIVACPHAKF